MIRTTSTRAEDGLVTWLTGRLLLGDSIIVPDNAIVGHGKNTTTYRPNAACRDCHPHAIAHQVIVSTCRWLLAVSSSKTW
jgi:hypothetical protein